MGLHLPDDSILPLLEVVSEHTGVDSYRLLQRGGRGWGRSAVMQPLLVAVGLATAKSLGAFGCFTGHSLGEFTAWVAAGGCDAADGVRLAALRGRLMTGIGGGMVAFPEGAQPPVGLELAVINPGQRVYSGPEDAIEAAVRRGGRRLDVDGPWHSSALAQASAHFAAALGSLPLHPAPGWLGPLTSTCATEALGESLSRPFNWKCRLGRLAVERTVVCGPARPLLPHLRALGVKLMYTDTLKDYNATKEWIECNA